MKPKQFYIQTEVIRLTATKNYYDVILDKRFKFCNGVLPFTLSTQYTSFFGLRQGNENIIERTWVGALNSDLNVVKQIDAFKLVNFPAQNNRVSLYIEVDSIIATPQITVIFLLSNEEIKENKRTQTFLYIDSFTNWNSKNRSFNPNIDLRFKNIIGFATQNGVSTTDTYLTTVKNNRIIYLSKTPLEYFYYSTQKNYDERFLPVEIENSQDLEVILERTSSSNLTGFFAYIFLLEDENFKRS